ncbi:MAG: hypothetical protein E7650_07970 [Ruminococcaceae bacterium]|nr:hypothetical protein [Oscillospiraceae bacterium]
MSALTVIGWTSFDSGYPTIELSDENMEVILPLLAEEIGKNDYAFSGEAHQYSNVGMPVFSNGTAFRASMRCWGAIMASLHAEDEGAPYEYMDFYMSTPGEEKMPEVGELPVPPSLDEEEDFSGCTVEEDHDLLRETLMNRMPLLTTDKTLRVLYESILAENQ